MSTQNIQVPLPPSLELFFHSAPSSPRSSTIYSLTTPPSPSSTTIPFGSDQCPLIPEFSSHLDKDVHDADANHRHDQDDEPQVVKNNLLDDDHHDTEFDFGNSGHLRMGKAARPPLSADELFDRGIVRPLNFNHDAAAAAASTSPTNGANTRLRPPPTTYNPRGSIASPAKAPPSASKYPFQEAAVSTAGNKDDACASRGRRNHSTRKGISRSLSPVRFRISEFALLQQQQLLSGQELANSPEDKALGCGGRRKWRLKDLFLFRSASEGRAANRYPLNRNEEHQSSKTLSFRSADASCHRTKNKKMPLLRPSRKPWTFGFFGFL